MLKTIERKKRIVFCVDRDILVSQTIDKLDGFGIKSDIGIIKADYPSNPDRLIQVASLQTLQNRELPSADLYIIDECHERIDQQLKIKKHYGKSIFMLGMTATPIRSDGKGMGLVYDDLITNITIPELIEKGNLVPEKVIAPYIPPLGGVKARGGDYVTNSLERAVAKKHIIADAVKSWYKYAKGMRTMVYTVSKKHARLVYKMFTQAGIPSAIVTGETVTSDRAGIIASLIRGETLALINVQVYVKGADIPELECIMDMAPTMSLSAYIQKIGRGGRPCPEIGKDEFLQIDHAGNVFRHGYWSDNRIFDLESGVRGKKDAPASVKPCPNCFVVCRSIQKQCHACGYAFPQAPESTGKNIKVVDGEMREVERYKIRLRSHAGRIEYESKDRQHKIPYGMGECYEGEFEIKVIDNKYNFYGKTAHTTEEIGEEEIVKWLLQKSTGSKKRRWLVDELVKAQNSGKDMRGVFMRYKRRYKHYPKMD
jgi:superfamily II DNA or RNA helicase